MSYYYYNLVTREVQWTRPPDVHVMAWNEDYDRSLPDVLLPPPLTDDHGQGSPRSAAIVGRATYQANPINMNFDEGVHPEARSSNDEAGSLSRMAAVVSDVEYYQTQMFNGSEQAPPSVNSPHVEIGEINDALTHVGVVFCQNDELRPAFYARERDDLQRTDGLMVVNGL